MRPHPWAVFVAIALFSQPIGAVALELYTGPETGTYIKIGKDIASVRQPAEVEIKTSEGSIDNIRRLYESEEAAVGIVQSDVLGFIKRSSNPETMKIAQNLRVVLPLYREEVHVLARRGIERFEDLQGQRVVIGADGSGNMLTAVNLLALMDVKVSETLRLSPPEGALALLAGEADAVIFVGGKPVKLFENVGSLDSPENADFAALLQGIHFLPLNAPKMLAEYSTAEITPQDYAFVASSVPTIAVQAMLITYEPPDEQAEHQQRNCRDIAGLTKSIREALPQLQQHGHAKWKEVRFDSLAPLWQKDACSWPKALENNN